MSEHIEAEFTALKDEYQTYLQRFRDLHGSGSAVVPLSVRQYCAAAVLCDQAWQGRNLNVVSELQNLMLLS